MDSIEYQNWALTRKKGRRSYLLKTGILKFLLPDAVLLTMVLTLFSGKGTAVLQDAWQLLLFFLQLLVVIVIGIPFALLYAGHLWKKREEAFRQFEASHPKA